MAAGTYRLGSRFGPRPDPFGSGRETFHAGVDLKAPQGVDPLVWERSGPLAFAVGGGVVVESRRSESVGHLVRIELDDKTPGRVSYMHLNARAVERGDRVAPGDIVGVVGSTGNVTGPHLHLEWKPAGAAGAVDPLPMWRVPDDAG
jgi:murein DD-endopeptidase MepM/ murein hydrolase activator NlpD